MVPADNKWFARLVVARAMIETLEGLDLEFPKVEGAALEELQKVRAALVAEEWRQCAGNAKVSIADLHRGPIRTLRSRRLFR